MIVIRDQFSIKKIPHKVYIVLGSFDGLHIGHMSLIQQALSLSKKNDCKSMVYTFENHPLTVISPEHVPKRIMNTSTKMKIFEKVGIDILNLIHFDEKFMKIEPEEFIHKILESYDVQGIVVGYNYRFGHKNQGDVNLLQRMGKELGFEVCVVKAVEFEENAVSSTRIRSLIGQGQIEEANKMLFQPYCIEGVVGPGKKLGRKLGFPTANIQISENYILPANGVYYTVVEYNQTLYKAITSVGKNPTVNGKTLTIEAHILDFNEDIYDKGISVYFLEKIREEIKFDSIEALSAQIQQDKSYAESKTMVKI